MITKERYADNLYSYLIKRNFFRKLIFNNEMNKIAKTFLEKIHDQIVKKVINKQRISKNHLEIFATTFLLLR